MAEQEKTGILPAEQILGLVVAGSIDHAAPLESEQVQPASLDLRLSTRAYRVRASFLPGPKLSVADRLDSLKLHEFDLSDGAVLETGCVYIIPLMERLNLPDDVSAAANPKSSTGRLDIFTRIITDRAREFDHISPGYNGRLYIEVSPRTFPIVARAGSRPLLDGASLNERLDTLLAERDELYRRAAHHVVETEGLTIEETAGAVEAVCHNT